MMRRKAPAVLFLLLCLIPVSAWSQEEDPLGEAVSLFYGGRFAQAREAFAGILAVSPGSVAAWRVSYWMGACSLELKEYEQALQYLARVEDGDALYCLHSLLLSGIAYEELDRFDEAANLYERILAEPSAVQIWPEAAFRLAGIDFRAGRVEEARGLYGRILLVFPPSAFVRDSLFFGAECDLAMNDFDSAAKRYRTLLSLYPDSPYRDTAAFRIAEIASGQGMRLEALKLFEDFIGAFPGSHLMGNALALKGDVLLDGGDIAGAIASYARALETLAGREGDQEIRYKDALGLLLDGRREEAMEMLDLSKHGPSSGISERSLFLLGSLLAEDGRASEAESVFRSLVNDYAAGPRHEDSLRVFAGLLFERGDVVGAASLWDELIRGYPGSPFMPEYLYRRGLASLDLGGQGEALEDFQRIARDFPRSDFSAEATYAIGAVYAERGEFSRAFGYFRSAADSAGPGDLQTRSRLAVGVCRFNLGSFGEAAAGFDELLLLVDDAQERETLLLYAGRAYYRLESFDEAAVRFEQASSVAGAPVAAESSYWLAWCNYRLGKLLEAKASFLAVSEMYPQDRFAAESLLRAADCAVALSDDEGGIEILDRLLSPAGGLESGTNAMGSDMRETALYEKGWALDRLGKTPQSGDVFEQLAREYPYGVLAAEAFFTRASRASSRGRWAEASADFTRVYRDFPSSPLAEQAAYWAAESELEKGDSVSAAESFWRSMESYPRGAFLLQSLDGLERSLTAAGSVDLARRYYEMSRNGGGLDPRAASTLGLIYARFLMPLDPEAAQAVIEEVAGLPSGGSAAAEAALLMGRYNASKELWSRAEEIFSDLSDTRADRIGAIATLELGRAREAQGRFDEAGSAYAALSYRFGDFPDLAAEGLWNAARVARERGETSEARAMEAELKGRYPLSPWTKKLAVERLIR